MTDCIHPYGFCRLQDNSGFSYLWSGVYPHVRRCEWIGSISEILSYGDLNEDSCKLSPGFVPF